jgi:peptide/nickel transport system substrate-binding protein
MKKLRWVARLLPLVMIVACIGSSGTGSAIGSTQAGGLDQKSKIVVGYGAEPTEIDPQHQFNPATQVSTYSVNESLTDIGANGKPVGVLAKSVTQDPHNRLRWIAKLRKGITFHDGTRFNADAVVANVQRILDPAFGSQLLSDLGFLAGAKKIDAYTVAILTSKPDPYLDFRLRNFRIVSPTTPHVVINNAPPIGTGPYRFKEFVRGDHLTLSANPRYWGTPKPTVGEVKIRFIGDDQTRESAFAAGEIDLNLLPVLSNLNKVAKSGALIIRTNFATAAINVRYNLTVPPLNDVRFRRALNYAINAKELNYSLFGGVYKINNCQFGGPGIFGYNDKLKPWPYNPVLARRLLSQVNIPQGYVLHLVATTTVGYTQPVEAAQAIAAYWQAVGVNATVQVVDRATFLDLVRGPNKLKSEAVYFQADNAFRNVIRQIGTYGVGNVSTGGDAVPEMVRIAEAALNGSNPKLRLAAIHLFLKNMCEQAWGGYLLNAVGFATASKRIRYVIGAQQVETPLYNRVTIVK